MRLVHLSDLHLGFRAYARLTRGGINQREADVARSFEHAIAQTIALAPELVVIGGDIFHQVRPSNTSIKHAYQQFARLRAGLPSAEIVMVSGNHDTPKLAETGSILGLFSSLEIRVVDGPAQVIDFAHLDLTVMAVPDNHHARPELVPSGERRFNVLIMHGEATGISPKGSPAAKRELSADDMHAAAWDYVGLGHYHVYREIAPNCYYSGAVDYTTSDIWGERREELEKGIPGKGIIERDLVSGTHTFHPLPSTRPIHDLTPIDSTAVLDLNVAVREALEPSVVDGAIMRLKIMGVPRGARGVRSQLDQKMLREYERRALNLQIDLRADVVKAHTSGGRFFASRAPLDQQLRQYLTDRELPASVDRDEFVESGMAYLYEAGESKAVISEEVKVSSPVLEDVAA